jgi:type IV secretory pathway VirD2 relaxase
VASVRADRLLTARSRRVTVKLRIVRSAARSAPLAAHLGYLRREGVTRDGEKAGLFGPGDDPIDPKAFAERCQEDRHHFRIIVSPEDAADLADLRDFGRELIGQMETDLGTRLDWVAVDHWNTAHPHLHIILRGVTETGEDLVIARAYITSGIRARAQALATEALGPRTDGEIHRTLENQVEAERWTDLDRRLSADAGPAGVIELAPHPGRQPGPLDVLKVARLRRLEGLDLARQLAPGRWVIDETAETTLRALGERGDIIKRIHRGLAERGLERAAQSYVLAGERLAEPIVGRLVDRGLDDELRGSAYALVDGIDGRVHHIRLPDLEAAADGPVGSIVELRWFEDRKGRPRAALAVRSDLSIGDQVAAEGSTWLDRQLVAREPVALAGTGFGAEVREALRQRTDRLVERGLAERRAGRAVFAKGLIDRLRRQELDRVGERLAAETGRAFHRVVEGEPITGVYRRRLDLASGRFALIDDGLGFQLVPWTPSIEKELGRHVFGVARADGGVAWTLARQRGLGL